VALLTSTQVAAEPFVFEETAQGKAPWKRPKNRVSKEPGQSAFSGSLCSPGD